MSNKIDNMQLQGSLREEALVAFAEQTGEWGIAMPAVEPLVMDFGLGDFYRTGLIEYWLANEIEAGYCAKYLHVFDGQECPAHRHEQKHETFHIVKGMVRLVVEGEAHTLSEGGVLVMPPGRVHSFTGLGNALIVEISTPCLVADNYFVDPAIDAWLRDSI